MEVNDIEEFEDNDDSINCKNYESSSTGELFVQICVFIIYEYA